MVMAGYSGTPLARKLGIKEAHLLAGVDGPPDFVAQLDLPPGARVMPSLGHVPLDVIVLFARLRDELYVNFIKATKHLTPNGSLWVAWPKTTARKRFGIASDITEDVVRAVAFPQGFVDTKVCAIDELWSGLRCVLRLENRPKPTKGGGGKDHRRR